MTRRATGKLTRNQRVGQEPRLFVGLVLILIFSEAIALFGLIVALVMSGGS